MRRGQRKNKTLLNCIIKLPKKWITRRGKQMTWHMAYAPTSVCSDHSHTHSFIHSHIHIIFIYAIRQSQSQSQLLLQSSSRSQDFASRSGLRAGTSINNCKRICQACQSGEWDRAQRPGRAVPAFIQQAGRQVRVSCRCMARFLLRTCCDKFAMSSALAVACKVRQLECKCCAIMLYDECKYPIDTLLYICSYKMDVARHGQKAEVEQAKSSEAASRWQLGGIFLTF